jgi:hypothetical protein
MEVCTVVNVISIVYFSLFTMLLLYEGKYEITIFSVLLTLLAAYITVDLMLIMIKKKIKKKQIADMS